MHVSSSLPVLALQSILVYIIVYRHATHSYRTELSFLVYLSALFGRHWPLIIPFLSVPHWAVYTYSHRVAATLLILQLQPLGIGYSDKVIEWTPCSLYTTKCCDIRRKFVVMSFPW